MASSLRLVCLATFTAHTSIAVPLSNKLVRQQDPSRLHSDARGNLVADGGWSHSSEVERHVDASGRIIAAGAHKAQQQESAERVHIDSKVRGVEAIEEEADRTFDGFRVDSELLPYGIMQCEDGENGLPAETTEEMSVEQYDSIVDDIHATLGNLSAHCDDTICPRGEFAGCILRFAGHDFMDYKNGTGGSDGCLSFAEPDNIGLSSCLTDGVGNPPRKLQTSYNPVCGNISFADFIIIAAEAVMTFGRQQAMDENGDLQQIDFKTQFKYGRNTSTSCAPNSEEPAVPLPDPGGSCGELQRVFIDNMELTWEETAALSGAHTMGRTKLENSGYKGYWGKPSERGNFDNNYFVSLAMRGWKPKKSLGGDSNKNVWIRSDHASSDYKKFEKQPVMMLDTDMCLLYKNNYNTTLFAKDQLECCAWLGKDTVGAGGNRTYTPCASAKDDEEEGDLKDSRGWCCGGDTDHLDCSEEGASPSGLAAEHVLRFARNDADWIEAFKKGWAKATENGHDDLIWLIAPEHKVKVEEKSHLMMILLISVPLVLIICGGGVYQMMNKEKPAGGRPMGQQQYADFSDGYNSY